MLFKKVWILGGWSLNESALLRVYKAIDRIDWKYDIVLAYNRAHQPHPDLLQFFNDRQRIKMSFPLLDRYGIDVSQALELNIEYVRSWITFLQEISFEIWLFFWFFKYQVTRWRLCQKFGSVPRSTRLRDLALQTFDHIARRNRRDHIFAFRRNFLEIKRQTCHLDDVPST